MTKNKRSSEMLADEKTIFGEKSHGKVQLPKFFLTV